jgi:hypothetical protein
VVSDQVCDKAYGGDSENRIVLPSMMCAGDMKKGNSKDRIWWDALLSEKKI